MKAIWYNSLLNKIEKMGMSESDCKHFIDFVSNVNITGKITHVSNGKVCCDNKFLTLFHKLAIMQFFYKYQELSDVDQEKLNKNLQFHGLQVLHIDSTYLKFDKRFTFIGQLV